METIRGDRGASAVEYGLLVSALAAVVVAIVFALGSVTQHSFSQSCDNLGSKMSPPLGCQHAP